ncbi:M48 family metalloprotease [Alkalilimnicola ehrlichii]|uniref:M48 family metalloprotease n=1 Tax=Alkalilimnicola ehrlichii TaxID=351052 RepID=UPI0015F26EDE|nr:M48 family metalloprotease [Alkalilimnicola ehrlichii]
MKHLVTAALLISVVLISPLMATEQPRLPTIGDPTEQYLSQSQERELGKQLMREIRRNLNLLEDPEVNAYIRDLGHRLASHSDSPEQEFHFFVVDNSAINAFAMPGGYIGINTGLILAARSESELAGVVAHEIAHVTQRHLARGFAESQRINLRTTAMLLASLILASQDPQAGSAAAMAGMAGSIQQQLGFSREHEYEADRVGIRILAAAGFDPMGMPRFFERLAQATQYRNQPPEWLSTHPLTEGRISDTASRARVLSNRQDIDVFETGEFELMQARLQVINSRRPDQAVNRFRRAIERNGTHPAYRYGLALALQADGQPEKAQALFEELLEAYPDEPIYMVALAAVTLEVGEVERSKELFEEVTSLYPNHEAARLRYAEALISTGDASEAQRLLNRGLPAAGSIPGYYWRLARAASEAGNTAEAHMAMAEHYYQEGELRSALTQLRQAEARADAGSHLAARASARAREIETAIRQRQSFD